MIGRTNASQAGGSVTPSGYKVQWIDVDGTILKTEYVASGSAATPPTATPNYDSTYLTFNSWNLPYSSITSPTNIGAMYTTPSYGSWGYSRTYAFLKINAASGYDTTIYLNTSAGGINRQLIDWGDGTTSSSITSMNLIWFLNLVISYPSYSLSPYLNGL